MTAKAKRIQGYLLGHPKASFAAVARRYKVSRAFVSELAAGLGIVSKRSQPGFYFCKYCEAYKKAPPHIAKKKQFCSNKERALFTHYGPHGVPPVRGKA